MYESPENQKPLLAMSPASDPEDILESTHHEIDKIRAVAIENAEQHSADAQRYERLAQVHQEASKHWSMLANSKADAPQARGRAG